MWVRQTLSTLTSSKTSTRTHTDETFLILTDEVLHSTHAVSPLPPTTRLPPTHQTVPFITSVSLKFPGSCTPNQLRVQLIVTSSAVELFVTTVTTVWVKRISMSDVYVHRMNHRVKRTFRFNCVLISCEQMWSFKTQINVLTYINFQYRRKEYLKFNL